MNIQCTSYQLHIQELSVDEAERNKLYFTVWGRVSGCETLCTTWWVGQSVGGGLMYAKRGGDHYFGTKRRRRRKENKKESVLRRESEPIK